MDNLQKKIIPLPTHYLLYSGYRNKELYPYNHTYTITLEDLTLQNKKSITTSLKDIVNVSVRHAIFPNTIYTINSLNRNCKVNNTTVNLSIQNYQNLSAIASELHSQILLTTNLNIQVTYDSDTGFFTLSSTTQFTLYFDNLGLNQVLGFEYNILLTSQLISGKYTLISTNKGYIQGGNIYKIRISEFSDVFNDEGTIAYITVDSVKNITYYSNITRLSFRFLPKKITELNISVVNEHNQVCQFNNVEYTLILEFLIQNAVLK